MLTPVKKKIENPPENSPPHWRLLLFTKQVQFAMDLTVLVIAFALSYLLRFDFAVPPDYIGRALLQMPLVVLVQFTALLMVGVYSFIWRYIGLMEVRVFLKAAVFAAIPLVALRLLPTDILHQWRAPLSVIMFDTILAFGGVLALRVLRRDLYERSEKRRGTKIERKGEMKPVLLIGAGRSGVMTVKEILGRGDAEIIVKGFIDDDPHKQRAAIQGVKVLGTMRDLPRLVRELDIDHVVISITQTSRQDFRRILEICEQIPIKVRTIPGLYEILQGKVEVTRIRDLQIEDLLGRQPVQLDIEDMRRYLSGKAVMVTGAGGSIGSELVRQVAHFQPSKLILVERAEPALFTIDRELRTARPDLVIAPVIADIGDVSRMRVVLDEHAPQIIFHAAAHKHVPMMECNPTEAVKNNVLGTHALGALAGEFGVEAFVLISTDKAVRPTSVMGASKRVAELVIQDLNERYATRYMAVRFGNVIGSTGSVIPIIREQIRNGGPVTVTHADMTRYFMTIPEASQLVLQAGAMGEGGEIFILDMGEPVKILDLAKDTIRLSGFKPFEEIDIVFTGIRPGEKLVEVLDTEGEQVVKTRHPKILIGRIHAYKGEKIRQALEELTTIVSNGRDAELRKSLSRLLPESQLGMSVEQGNFHQTPTLANVSRENPGASALRSVS